MQEEELNFIIMKTGYISWKCMICHDLGKSVGEIIKK